MTDDQIRRIMEGMAEQNKVLSQQNAVLTELKKEGEERANAHYKVWQSLREDNRKLSEQIEVLTRDTAPVIKLSKNVQGFDHVAVWIFKFLLGVAALIGAGGTILYFIRKLIIPR
jgi:hypothetical protein